MKIAFFLGLLIAMFYLLRERSQLAGRVRELEELNALLIESKQLETKLRYFKELWHEHPETISSMEVLPPQKPDTES